MVGQMRTYKCRWLAVIPVRRTVPRVAMFGTGFGFIGTRSTGPPVLHVNAQRVPRREGAVVALRW